MKRHTKIISVLLVIILIAVGVSFVLQKGSSSHVPSKPINAVFYSCNSGKTIFAEFYKGENRPAPSPNVPPVPGGSVSLKLSDGRTMTLPQTISADGARYANQDESFVFWSKGNGALVLENNQEKTYLGCIVVVPNPPGRNLSKVYSNGSEGFSLRYPEGYKVDEKYAYNLELGKDIHGIKFTIPESVATGTNLGQDSYISVEELPKTSRCSAKLFLSPEMSEKNIVEGNTTYSVASSTGAGAGNRYEEIVYALPATNPCIAVRYFVHYSVFENYPPGTVREFDKKSLLDQFDSVRRTLIVNQ